MKKGHYGFFPFLIIIYAAIFILLPIIVEPKLLLARGNDLQEQFWPVFYFIREQFWKNHSMPLWNNLWFSGLPLLPDPQFSLFYPFNVIFILLPTDIGFIIYFLVHIIIGGVGTFITARYGFHFAKNSSLFCALLYISQPRLAGYLEAGHYGLVASLAWLPFVLLGVIKLSRQANFFWAIVLSVALAGLFYTHPVNFLLTAIISVAIFITLWLTNSQGKKGKNGIKPPILFAISGLLVFGLTAITLLPQIEWLPDTTRSLLLKDRDVYPKWSSFNEFILSVLWPIKLSIWEIDTEKWIPLGIITSFLGFHGFLQVKKKFKILLLFLLLAVFLVATNTISPIYPLLLSQDWYALMRVTTRIWFIPGLALIFLAGLSFESLYKKLPHVLLLIIFGSAITESIFLSWARIYKPADQQTKATNAVYEFLKSDKGRFRVFCVTRCLSQKEAAKYNLELVEGYNTLQQKNYYDQFIQLSQVFWNRYTLALPPFEIYTTREIQPYAPELTGYNVKYIISPHALNDKSLILKEESGEYLIYENPAVKSRAYFSNGKEAPILKYSPNYIKVDTSSHETRQLIVAEVYNSGWIAKLNGEKLTEIKQTSNKLRQIEIEKDTLFIEMRYNPKSYQLGRIISLSSLFIVFVYLAYLFRRKQGS